MKRLLFILVLMIPMGLAAQTSSLDGIYEEYTGRKGYRSIVYGKKMISIMKEDASTDVRKLLNGIRTIRIISHEGSDGRLCEDVQQTVRRHHELISRIDEDGSSSLFYLYEGNDAGADMSFVMLVSAPGSQIVLEIIGRFDVKDISKLSVIGTQNTTH